MTRLADHTVVAYRGGSAEYLNTAPFHPQQNYPEYSWRETASEPNASYEAVRGCLHLAGLDAIHYDTSDWNPLAELIRPGETVLLKPNMVHQRHPRDPQGWRYVITHGSIIRAVADYVWKAIGPRGKIILADAPQTDASFSKMVSLLGLEAFVNFTARAISILKSSILRREEWTTREECRRRARPLPANAYGEIAFDLGERSEFADHAGDRPLLRRGLRRRSGKRSSSRRTPRISGCGLRHSLRRHFQSSEIEDPQKGRRDRQSQESRGRERR